MNRIYRLVWNRTLGVFQVASEFTRAHTRGGRAAGQGRARRLAWLVGVPLGLPLAALAGTPVAALVAPTATTTRVAANALPTGGTVSAGSGSITQGGGSTLTVTQQSQNLSLDWQSFNIGADGTVDFLQPNAGSIAVNRIADPNGSVILGHLNANGQVFLINPNGVLFGQGAQVDVGGLVASTLDVSDSELGSGTLHFAGNGRGSVVNRGTIDAAHGYVALLGPQVTNAGTLRANGGTVALAGGTAVTLSFDGNRLLSMQVDKSTLNALADNRQLVVADGGQVLMSAGAKDSLLASVVNNSGTIQAQTVQNHAGRIVLLGGMAAGSTTVAGTLDASAPGDGNGGFIETSAAHVQVADGAKISTLAASGKTGTWLIDPTDFTIGANKAGTITGGTPSGDISGATLDAALVGSDVTILSSQGSASGSGDINVDDTVSWGANTLTLTAAHDINVNAVMTASGSAGLVLNTATGNGADGGVAGGSVNVMPGEGGRVDFIGAGNTLSINSQPYTIITALTDLQFTIMGDLSGHYALGADIDASATATAEWNGGGGFLPLGNVDTRFAGVFNGLGHTISGLTINQPSADYIGLFGFVDDGGVIANVGLLGGSVTGENSVGGVVGSNLGAINRVYATGAVNGVDYIGGLVGTNDGGTISHAHAAGVVSGSGTNIGGLAGGNRGSVIQAYATGAVSGSGALVGGLVGGNYNTIHQAFATGTVGGDDKVGGLVGRNYGAISEAYATGAVNSTSGSAGGLVGYNGGAISETYAIGAVSGGGSLGGLVGDGSSTLTSGVYWDTETTGQATSVGGTGLTTAALIAALPDGFDASAWGNGDNQTTPYLLGMAGNQVFNVNDLPAGAVTASNRPNLYTVILDVDQLQAVGAGLTGHYVLGNDIDASATAGWNAGAGFAPLGDSITQFTGVFDGLDHTISGLTIDRPSTNGVGLFGYTGAGSVIRNLGLLGGTVSGGADTGFLVGYVSGGTISQVYATGPVSGSNYVGGLVGYSLGTISQAYATGAVSGTASSIGGLVGSAADGTISQAYATGAVSGMNAVGGLVGINASTNTISQAYATGAVSGTTYVGGLVGIGKGTISQAYATGAVSGTGYVGGLVGYHLFGTISQAYATGAISGAGYVGGLIGQWSGTGTLTNGYWDTEATGQATSAGTGSTGLTTAQMMDPANFAAWGTDISATGGSTAAWRIYDGHTAPLLRAFMTNLAVTGAATTYDGTAFAGVGAMTFGTLASSYWLPSTSVDSSLVLGSASTSAPAINAGSYALDGGLYSSQMGYDLDLADATVTIAPAALTISTSDVSKVYDGGLSAAGTAMVTGGMLFGSDTINGGSFAFADKNVGTGKTVTVSGVTVSDGNSGGNYVVTYADNTTSAITPATLTLADLAAANKVYDATTAATATGSLSGVLGSDDVDATLAASFADKNVGTGKTVTVDGITLGGTDAGNYVIADGQTTTAAIRAATLTLADLSAADKVYDATTTATATGSLSGVLGSDDVDAALAASFADKNVDTGKIVTVDSITLGGTDAGNYVIADGQTTTAAITAATLTLADLAAADKVYDATTTATATGSLSGVRGSDDVDAALAANFADKNVGTGKTVTVDGITLGGTDAGNYVIADGQTTTAAITAATLTLSDLSTADKVYDATTAATATGSLSGVIGNDDVDAAELAASFADKKVGTGKTVTVVGTLGGTDAGNYVIADGQTTTAAITAATLTLADLAAADKVYDATTAATATGSLSGVLGSDDVDATLAASFADKNVGTGKTVTVDGITLGGTDAGNYVIADGQTTTADISKRAIIVDATGTDRIYDGTTADTVSLASTGVLAGDAVDFSGTGGFADKNVGTAKTVAVTGITASGTDAGNYRFDTTAATTADVTPLRVTVDATGTDRVYDGTTADAVSLASSGILAGDSVTFSGTGAFADKNAGTDKTVAVSGIEASGTDAGNYRFATTTSTSADITPATLTYRAAPASFWTGQTPSGLSGEVQGLVGGDSLGDASEGTLTWTTPATSASPAGQYAIDGGGLTARNYVFTQASGNATALRVDNGGVPAGVTAVVAGLQQDTMRQDAIRKRHTLVVPDVRVIGGGVHLP